MLLLNKSRCLIRSPNIVQILSEILDRTMPQHILLLNCSLGVHLKDRVGTKTADSPFFSLHIKFTP